MGQLINPIAFRSLNVKLANRVMEPDLAKARSMTFYGIDLDLYFKKVFHESFLNLKGFIYSHFKVYFRSFDSLINLFIYHPDFILFQKNRFRRHVERATVFFDKYNPRKEGKHKGKFLSIKGLRVKVGTIIKLPDISEKGVKMFDKIFKGLNYFTKRAYFTCSPFLGFIKMDKPAAFKLLDKRTHKAKQAWKRQPFNKRKKQRYPYNNRKYKAKRQHHNNSYQKNYKFNSKGFVGKINLKNEKRK